MTSAGRMDVEAMVVGRKPDFQFTDSGKHMLYCNRNVDLTILLAPVLFTSSFKRFPQHC